MEPDDDTEYILLYQPMVAVRDVRIAIIMAIRKLSNKEVFKMCKAAELGFG